MEEERAVSKRGCKPDTKAMEKTAGNPPASKSKWHVNRKLLPVKALFFTVHAAMGCQLPYVIVFTKQLGLTSQESGMLFGVLPFLSFLAQVGIGMIADRWRKHKATLMLCLFFTGVFNVLITAVPRREQNRVLKGDVIVKCDSHVFPSLMYCGQGLRSHVSHGTEVSENASEPLDSWSQENTGFLSSKLDNISSMTSERLEWTCPQTLFQVLHAISMHDNSSQMTSQYGVTCHASCPSPFQGKSGKMCIQSNTDENTITSSYHSSDHCNWTGIQTFPQNFDFQSINKIIRGHHIIAEGNHTSASDEQVNSCIDFYVTSLLVGNQKIEGVQCDFEQAMDCTVACNIAHSQDCPSTTSSFDLTFCLVLVTQLVAALALAPIFPMNDAICYSTLKDELHLYGRQRAWGTVGWLVVSIGASLGIYVGKDLDYAYLFYAHGALLMLSVVTAYFLVLPSDICCGNVLKNTKEILAMPKVAVFLLVCTIFGMMIGAVNFVFWYLEDLGAPPLIFSLYSVVGTAVEVPAFLIVGRFIKRFGPIPCFCVGVALFGLRLTGYALLKNPWLALLVVSINGITVSTTLVGSTSYITQVTPPSMCATAQGLLTGSVLGLGRGTGLILTGWMIGAVGPRITFVSYTGAGLITCVLYGFLYHRFFRESFPSKADGDKEDRIDIEMPNSKSKKPSTPVNDVDKSLCDGTDHATVALTSDPSDLTSARENRHPGTCDPLLADTQNNMDVENV